jgi:hypothetical protein
MVDSPHDSNSNGADRDAAQTLSTTAADVVPLPRWRRGFVALPRGWLDHPVFRFRASVYSRAEAFAWLVEQARYTPQDHLERGQLRASIRTLGDAWKWHPSTVLKFLRNLRAEQLIDFRGHVGRTNSTLITICNYGDFQRDASDCGTLNRTIKPRSVNRVLNQDSNHHPISLTGDSPSVRNGGRRRRMTAIDNLWKGGADAVEAILARDAARALGDGDAPVATLLDSERDERVAPDTDRGLDRGSAGVSLGNC